VIFPGTSSQQALAFARRMHEQLDKRRCKYRDQVLKIRTSLGLAALDVDTVASIEDLMKMAQPSACRIGEPQGPAAARPGGSGVR